MKKLISAFIAFLSLCPMYGQGEGLNTAENINGVLLHCQYSLAPIESMSPKPSPLSIVGCGISLVTNETLQLGIYGSMSLPTANYAEGYTLEADTIDIDFSIRDIKLAVGYMIHLDAINANVSPYLGLGLGDVKINRIDYYDKKRKSKLESTNFVLVEPGVNFNYIVDKSFIVSLGVSYQVNIPDRLLINYSSQELNVLKINLGISFGMMLNGGGSSYRRRR